MKSLRNLILTAATLMFAFSLSAQKIDVKEGNVNISKGGVNGFTVELHTDDMKVIEQEWKGIVKKYKTKLEGKIKTELFCDNAEIKAMSANTIDIYAVANEAGDVIRFSACFDLGGAFVNSREHQEAAGVANKIMEDFAMKFAKSMLEAELKEQEKVLKKLEKEKEGLEKDKEGYEQDIEDAEKKIEERKSDIEQNIKDQEQKVGEIEKEKVVLDELQKKLDKID